MFFCFLFFIFVRKHNCNVFWPISICFDFSTSNYLSHLQITEAFLSLLLLIVVILFCFLNSDRFISQGPLGGHWIYLSSAAMMNCAVSSLVCLALKANWRTLRDQAGSLYLSTGRMMFFSLVMTLGSKYYIPFLANVFWNSFLKLYILEDNHLYNTVDW